MQNQPQNVPTSRSDTAARISPRWHARGAVLVAIAVALACTGAMRADAAVKAVTQFVAGMSASGTTPFDANDNPGNDSGSANSIIRTNDFATYRVGYSITPSDSSGRIVLTVGATTTPSNYVGPASPKIAFFSVADLPTGANGCQGISASPVADPPAIGVSGVTADGQKLYCAQPSPSSGNNLDFRMRIAGTAPNGATVAAPTITFSSAGNPAQSLNGGSPTFDPAATPPVTVGKLVGTVGADTFYGLPTLTVSAAPRWNLAKSAIRGAGFVPGSGPNGEDGFVFSWNLGIFAKGSRKGLEAITGSYTIEENFNDPDFPNARFVNWNLTSAGYATIDMSATGQNGCGDWRSQFPYLGNVVDNGFYLPNDTGANNNSTIAYTVARGGTCDATAVDNTAKTATLTLNNTDFSLNFYPTKRGSNVAAVTLVNPSNLDDANNEWWVASKTVVIWAPITDVPTPPSPNTKLLTNTATLNPLTTKSVTGQANTEPISTDNANTQGATNFSGGSFSKIHSQMYFTANPNGFDLAPPDPNVTGDNHVNQVAPNQVLGVRIIASNNGTTPFPAGYICDKIDNTRFTFVDLTGTGYTAGAPYVKDPLTGIFTRPLVGPMPATTWELGVGGTGTNGSTWTSFNTVASEYTAPTTTGSAQSDSVCGDTDATWYPSIAALLAAEGANGLQKVTRIRGKYASMGPATGLYVFYPQRANATYTFSGVDNAPGAAFTTGTSTVGAMAVNQAMWQTNLNGTFGAASIAKGSDAVRIFQNEYVQISKTSPSNPIANSLVPVGSVVTYNLSVNLTTSGSAHTTSVDVWDVLPQYMSYIPGSSTLGGAALADPTCATSGLPAALFPTQPLTGGVMACKWTLPNQAATKTSIGAAAGNLPLIAFAAVVDVAAPSGTMLLNSSFADSTDNNKVDARFNGAGIGFQCVSGQNCSFSNWSLTVSATSGILLSKQVSKAVVPLNSGFTYTLNYGAIGNTLNGVRILDVLPYAGDGRLPATSYSGTLKLSAPIAAPIAGVGPPVVLADPDAIVLYTSNTAANINRDPYHAGHNLAGTGSNSATTSNWCTVAQFSSANCPANIGAATAFLLQPRLTAASNPNQLQPGNTYALVAPVIAAANTVGNVYSNDFVGDSTSLTARRPGSNIVTTTVVAPDLIITKDASPTTVAAGQPVAYTLTAKNNVGTNVGPVENVAGTIIRVTDPMQAGLTVMLPVTGTNWNCAASTVTAVDCTYVGTLPLGAGSTIGGPITVNAVVAASTANGATISNTATVSMSGTQSEQPTNNNTATATINVVRNPDAKIVKTVAPASVFSGGTVTYTLKASMVVGEGNLAGGPVVVTDTLPADITISSASAASGTNWNCAASAAPSTVSCTYTGSFPISAGSQIGGDIIVVTTAGNPAGAVVRNNSALVSAPGDTNPSNNTSTVPVTIFGSVSVSGRVYREASPTANLVDDGNGIDPGLVTNVSLSCTSPTFSAGPQATNADGTYLFVNVPAGAACTITETQPAGYTNAYTQTGTTGNPASNGAVSATGAGTTSNSTISIVVPTTGSVNNNFAEQSADMVSRVVCTPSSAAAGTRISCAATCTNNGPGAAVNAFCRITNAATLPGAPVPVCSANANVAAGATLSCTVSFTMPTTTGVIPVTAGTGADNDINGGSVASAGNNPSSASVTPVLEVPTLDGRALLLLVLSVLALGIFVQSRKRRR